MKYDTKTIKETNKAFASLAKEGAFLGPIADLLIESKNHFDDIFAKIKYALVEFLLFSEREELAGTDYMPVNGRQKWGSQSGSVYVAGERLKVRKPRVRKDGKEVSLSTYESLKDRSRFSEEILQKALCGISTRSYEQTLHGLLDNFGVKKSSVSRHLIQATTEELKKLKERSLRDFESFTIFLDGYRIAGDLFIVALGIDNEGKKQVLGFWQGATENHTICQNLLSELEDRGLVLSHETLFVTDGGKGIIKALKEKFGKELLHQRCTVHKDRNIQNHLPKKYRKEAHRKFRIAVDCVKYEDANKELKQLEEWLENINPSAAESLREGREELLTVHKLEVPPLLRKTLHSTNPIESMFSQVSHRHGNLKNLKKGMAQRWLGAALLEAERRFRTIKGHLTIKEVQEKMKAHHERLANVA